MVVTIIAILMAIGFISYRQFIAQAEDAQRTSDLKFIQSALEQYHADWHYYPPGITPGEALKGPGEDGKTYLTTIPKDPRGSDEYLYEPRGAGCSESQPENCTSYCLFVKLNDDSGIKDDPGCNPQDPYNHGVTRP